MLVAIDKNGKLVQSCEQVSKGVYFCPCCQKEVILKKGTIKLAHFAHKSLADCIGESENETIEHIKDKLLIAKNCEKFGINYTLEAYLPEINQRADVLLNNHIAIEFQCSSLKIERLKERTHQYQSNGYQVFWLLGDELGKKEGLSELTKNFLYFSRMRGYYIISLLVDKEQVLFKHYLSSKSSSILVKETVFSLSELSIVEILFYAQSNSYFVINDPIKEVTLRKNIIQKKLISKHISVLKLQEHCYLKGEHLLYLPPVVYFPSFYHPVLQEQELYIRLLAYRVLYQEEEMTYDCLKKRVNEELPSNFFSDYAIVQTQQLIDYVLSMYVSFLKKIDVLNCDNHKFLMLNYKKRINDEQIEKIYRNRCEILALPLKYDMIIK